MTGIGKARERFYWVGQCWAADFANTIRSPQTGGEALGGWQDLADFLELAGVLRSGEASAPRRWAANNPVAAERFFHAALQLRTAIGEVFAALARGRRADGYWVAVLNGFLRKVESYQKLEPADGSWRTETCSSAEAGARALARLAESAASILAQHPSRLRQCASPKCILFFYDTSRTARRRWCSMAVCGNRAKVAAFARRQQRRTRALR